jgi:hypothetical protein
LSRSTRMKPFAEFAFVLYFRDEQGRLPSDRAGVRPINDNGSGQHLDPCG